MQGGLDYELSDCLFVNASVRWIEIETDARIIGPRALGPIAVNNIMLDPGFCSV